MSSTSNFSSEYVYLLAEVLIVLGIPLVVFILLFRFLSKANQSSKYKWARVPLLVLVFASGFGCVAVLFIFATALVGSCPSGNCGTFKVSPVSHACSLEVKRQIIFITTMNTRFKKKLDMPPGTPETWHVQNAFAPTRDEVPLPENLHVEREEVLKDVTSLYRLCSYAFTCEVKRDENDKWSARILKMSVDRESTTIMHLGDDICRARQ